MCGHVGFLTTHKYTPMRYLKAIKDLLIVDCVRGVDGTGLLLIDNKLARKTIKAPVNALDFLKDEAVIDAMSPSENYTAICGHNRSATFGGHTVENTHPFITNDITLLHNGTLAHGWESYLGTTKAHFNDSAAICDSMGTIGVKETIEKLSGSYAFVIHDRSKNTISFARNLERPLYIATTKTSTSDSSIFYASEEGMLKWILSKHGIQIDSVMKLKDGVLLTFDLANKLGVSNETFKIKTNHFGQGHFGNFCNWYRKKRETISHGNATDIPSRTGSPTVGQILYLKMSGYNRNKKSNGGLGYIHGLISFGGDIYTWKTTNTTYETYRNYKDAGDTFKNFKITGIDFKNRYIHVELYYYDGSAYNTKSESKPALPVIYDHTASSLINGLSLDGDEFESLADDPVVQNNDQQSDITHLNGGWLSTKIFNTLVKDGCSFCSADLDENEATRNIHLINNHLFCPACAQEIESNLYPYF